MAKKNNTATEAAPQAVPESDHIMRPLGEPRHMPTDFTISLGAKGSLGLISAWKGINK